MQKRLLFKIDYVCKIPWGAGSCFAGSLSGKISETVSCSTQTYINTTTDSAIQATCQQVTQPIQSEETAVNRDLQTRKMSENISCSTQTYINTTMDSANQATCQQVTQSMQSEKTSCTWIKRVHKPYKLRMETSV